MFTGIIEARGTVRAIEPHGGFVRILIVSDLDLSDIRPGDSVAVDGACLTATTTNISRGEFAADVSPETLGVTTLGDLVPGSRVNLEKALRLDSRLGGHMVSGHIDCVGHVSEKRASGPGFLFGFSVESTVYLVEKGSVAVDGISLTVNRVGSKRFWVMIIPHTALLTGLTEKRINDSVNIEFDIVAKYIAKFARPRNNSGGIDENTLEKYGFI